MMKKLKEIDIKDCTYYFFDGMITIKSLDPNSQTKIRSKKSNKNIIYYIGYMTVKNLIYVTVNPLNLIIDKING